MSFLKTVPEELTAAAAQLGTIGAAMAAQNAAAAAPTTAIAPAALDEVSALQAALFTAYGTFYQQVSAEAQAMHDMFVNTLGISAGTYGVTESLNSSAAASPLSGITGEASAIIQATTGLFPPELSGGIGNILNIGAGNWASATTVRRAVSYRTWTPRRYETARRTVRWCESPSSTTDPSGRPGPARTGSARWQVGGSTAATETAHRLPAPRCGQHARRKPR